ncbi:hypothetical protein KIW84_055413 [Lathyrus oleraceus]|uniref:Uncharacterized protein n=1 Tax=Pisum sativum TaxID=3888 RepID=A0A9D5AFS3_PEA|nr:hypothetical protein KIW84_055413 [Pisum sativum]
MVNSKDLWESSEMHAYLGMICEAVIDRIVELSKLTNSKINCWQDWPQLKLEIDTNHTSICQVMHQEPSSLIRHPCSMNLLQCKSRNWTTSECHLQLENTKDLSPIAQPDHTNGNIRFAHYYKDVYKYYILSSLSALEAKATTDFSSRTPECIPIFFKSASLFFLNFWMGLTDDMKEFSLEENSGDDRYMAIRLVLGSSVYAVSETFFLLCRCFYAGVFFSLFVEVC